MNEGIVAMIVQWTLLLCIWMGLYDRQLRSVGLSRAGALAVLTAFLVCSFTDWQLYFLPIYINVSGAILPFLLAGWIWMKLPAKGREYILAASVLMAGILLLLRKLFFWDPVLLILDEELLIPIATLMLLCLITRKVGQQWFLLLISIPLSDLFYVISNLSVLSQYSRAVVGGPDSQDSFWISIALWVALLTVVGLVKRTIQFSARTLLSLMKISSKTEPNR